jgi:hypothetical protein
MPLADDLYEAERARLRIVDREEGGREVLEKEAPLVTSFRRSDLR